ncbi:MAG TPA: hypothetical protein VIZ90_10885 [Rhizobiaceae bacterium]
MFFRPQRGRRGPHILLIRDSEEPIRLEEARLAALALALGERIGRHDRPGRKPHRGMLPDVDFSQAVPVDRPSFPRRLLRWLAARPSGENPVEPAGGATDHGLALGETGRKPYVWLVEAEPGRERELPGLAGPSRAGRSII